MKEPTTSKTRWKLERTNEQVQIKIECDSPHRADCTYYWSADIFITNHGRMQIGETLLESINHQISEEPLPSKFKQVVAPSPVNHHKFERACNNQAELCLDYTKINESEFLPVSNQPDTREHRLAECTAVIDRLLNEASP